MSAFQIDKKRSLRFGRLDFDDNVTGGGEKRAFTAFHGDDVTVVDCTFGRSGGIDHIYLFNADYAYIEGNRVTEQG